MDDAQQRRITEVEDQLRELRLRLFGTVLDELNETKSDVAVLKERSGNTDRQLAAVAADISEVRGELKGVRGSIQEVLALLGEHTLNESRDRVRILVGILIGLAGIYAPKVIDILHSSP